MSLIFKRLLTGYHFCIPKEYCSHQALDNKTQKGNEMTLIKSFF